MKIFYDCEFWERGAGHPIVPISIGAVRDDGAELYLINNEFPLMAYALDEPASRWLRSNVAPFLPLAFRAIDYSGVRDAKGRTWTKPAEIIEWDKRHHDYKDHAVSLKVMREKMAEFVLGVDNPQLWAWYSSYDHVVLSQLFGRMSDPPEGFPMFTMDVRQILEHTVGGVAPPADASLHHALADARWTRSAWQALTDIAESPTN